MRGEKRLGLLVNVNEEAELEVLMKSMEARPLKTVQLEVNKWSMWSRDLSNIYRVRGRKLESRERGSSIRPDYELVPTINECIIAYLAQ